MCRCAKCPSRTKPRRPCWIACASLLTRGDCSRSRTQTASSSDVFPCAFGPTKTFMPGANSQSSASKQRKWRSWMSESTRWPLLKQRHLRFHRRERLGGFLFDARFSVLWQRRMLGKRGLAVGVELGLFEVAENFLVARDDFRRQSREARDLDAVAFVRAAANDFAQKDNLVVPFAHGDVEIFHAAARHLEFGQFVVVRREKCARFRFIV